MMRKENLLLLCILFLFCTTAASCNCPTGEYVIIEGSPLFQLQLATTSDGIISGTAFSPLNPTCSDYIVSGTKDGTNIFFQGEIQETNECPVPVFDAYLTTTGPLCGDMEGTIFFGTFHTEITMVPCASPYVDCV